MPNKILLVKGILLLFAYSLYYSVSPNGIVKEFEKKKGNEKAKEGGKIQGKEEIEVDGWSVLLLL